MSPRFNSPPPGPGSARLAAETDAADDDFLFSKPRPRPARTSAEKQEIRTRNRRREYLERNPGYFQSSEHELADPILYDSLIRRFQTPAERQAESKEKGYARVLEGSLMRGEEKLARLAAATAAGGGPISGADGGEEEQPSTTATIIQEQITATVTQASSTRSKTIQTLDEPTAITTSSTSTMFATFTSQAQQPLPHLGGSFNFGEPSSPSTNQTARSAAPTTSTTTATALALTGTDTPAQTREEGQEQWRTFLRERFVRGGDEDFDYAGLVDNDDELDTLERREQEEAWFDEEEPDWASDGEGKVERVLQGETGVQDF